MGVASRRALRHLNVSRNSLSGSIPTKGFSPTLEIIDLSSNAFTGELPNAWSPNKTCALQRLVASQNALGGSLHASLFNEIPNTIEVIDLSHNYLTGNIHALFDKITTKTLQIDADGRSRWVRGSLTGYNLVMLDLSYNLLATSIAMQTCDTLKYPQLRTLRLNHNALSCFVPYGAGFQLHRCSEGATQGDCCTIEELDVSANYLSGELRVDNTELNLVRLNVSDNLFGATCDLRHVNANLVLDLRNNTLMDNVLLDYCLSANLSDKLLYDTNCGQRQTGRATGRS